MSDSSPSPPTNVSIPPSPLRSLSGALLSATLGLLLYRLTAAMVQSFAQHPVLSHKTVVINLTAAVRTLVVGLATMATGIFAIAALGLVALAIQTLVRQVWPARAKP
ncbi:MAG: DUF3082 domain-containing protein [Thermosynechococcaceae cyanobacterium]